jgi:hypothetical protein
MSNDERDARPEHEQSQSGESDRRYAEKIGEHESWPIGDTNEGTGTLRPDDDIGTGGTADVAGARDFGDTSSIRTGNIGVGGILGTQLGDIGSMTGAAGPSQEERGGLDSLSQQPVSASADDSPGSRTVLDRAEDRVDTSAGGALNLAAVDAAGLDRVTADEAHMTGTDDLGAAAGQDLGAGLGGTRGSGSQNPRGEITGVGGTRGSGAGTGHLEDTPS